jgi:hypothetical protein
MGCHPSHWRTPSFFKMLGIPPTRVVCPYVFVSCAGNFPGNFTCELLRFFWIDKKRPILAASRHRAASDFIVRQEKEHQTDAPCHKRYIINIHTRGYI